MKEIVGSQDQIAASYGGFNKITFYKSNFKLKKIKKTRNVKLLENNLILIYTGINRTAHKIAASYNKKLISKKKEYIDKIITLVDQGEKLLSSGDINDFGELLNEGWYLKKKLSHSITE